MNNYQILSFITNGILWVIIIVGALGVLAGLLWLSDVFITYIFKALKAYPILIEFAWNRSKYKKLLKEGDYETIKSGKE